MNAHTTISHIMPREPVGAGFAEGDAERLEVASVMTIGGALFVTLAGRRHAKPPVERDRVMLSVPRSAGYICEENQMVLSDPVSGKAGFFLVTFSAQDNGGGDTYTVEARALH